MKTGTTDGAGSCLSATATRDGLSLISVVMGCPTSNDRFASARGLLDFGFANYQSVAPPPVDSELSPVPVLRGVEESVMPVHDDPGKFVIEKGKAELIKQEITLVPDLEAPVVAGQVVGKVEVLVDGELMGQYDLKAGTEVERMTFLRAFVKLLKSMLRMNRGGASIKASPAPNMQASSLANPPKADEKPVCTCPEGKCYCEEIGDICGCTNKV